MRASATRSSSAVVWWFGVEEVGGCTPEGAGEVVHERQPRLALAVLDLGQVGGLSPDECSEFVQREVPAAPEMAEALPEDERVENHRIHP